VVQCAAGDEAVTGVCRALDDADSRQTLLAERGVVRALGADCHSCLAVHICPADKGWQGMAMAAAPDGSGRVEVGIVAVSAGHAGNSLLEALRSRGTQRLLGH